MNCFNAFMSDWSHMGAERRSHWMKFERFYFDHNDDLELFFAMTIKFRQKKITNDRDEYPANVKGRGSCCDA